jgi:hypothetical protein
MHDIIKHNHNFITGQITIYKGKSIRLKILKIISSNKKFNFKWNAQNWKMLQYICMFTCTSSPSWQLPRQRGARRTPTELPHPYTTVPLQVAASHV